MRSPRPAPRRVSTQAYLLGLVAAVVIPLLAFAGFLLTRYAATERARFEREAGQIARQVALVVDAELGGLVALLKGLSTSTALATGDLAQFHAEAIRLVEGRDEIVVLRELGPAQFLNTQRPYGTALPPAVALSEADQAALRSGRALVGDVYASPISGEPRVAVAFPILRNGAAAHHVLAITVPTSRIRDVLLPAVPPGWIVGVGDRNGTYVTRSARHEDATGKPGVPEYLAKAVGRSGTFTSVSFEGSALLAGYQRAAFSDWLFAANVAQATVEAPLWRSLTLLAALGAAALALSVLLAYGFGRGFTGAAAELAQGAAALGQGRPVAPVPTRLRELALVGEALAAAASAVDERARERERAVEREALLGSIFDAAGLCVGVVEMLDDDYLYVAANRGTAELAGRAEGGIEGLRASELGFDAGAVRFWLDLCRGAHAAGGPTTLEYGHTRVGRGDRWYLGTFTPLPAAPSGRSRVAFTAIDITDRRRAEEALRARTHELETVLATVPAAVLFTYDPQVRHVTRNRFAAELMRVPEGETGSLADPNETLAHVRLMKDGRAVEPRDMPLQRAMRGELVEDEEYAYVFQDGSGRTLLTSATALRAENGAIVGAVSVSLDISERKRGEERNQLLIHELNHRVKNTLATVQAIAVQTLRGAESIREVREALTDRLIALAKAHDVLTRESWEGAELHDIVADATGPHGGADRFSISGPPVWLGAGLSLSLALALHELATNAAKYGALSAEGGSVTISWDVADPVEEPRLTLRWVERGGPPVRPPSRQGFGSRLIQRSLSAEVGASACVDYAPDGVVCVVEAPIRPRAAVAAVAADLHG